jgi:GNAT superfamily N-acetyltransferase
MTITVRPIAAGEGGVLLEMVKALAEDHGFADKMKSSPADLEAALFAPQPIVGCLLAFYDGAPAGCAFWHRSFATSRGREVMYLEDLSVLPPYRRKGVARALLKELARLARAKRFPSIYWIMMGRNEPGRALYREIGAELEDGLTFCRLADDALERLAGETP